MKLQTLVGARAEPAFALSYGIDRHFQVRVELNPATGQALETLSDKGTTKSRYCSSQLCSGGLDTDVGGELEQPTRLLIFLTADEQPFPLAGLEGKISASIGISIYPTDGTDIESLSADSAMYRAKQAGKNTYRFFSGAMDSRNRVGMR